jgi:RNA polymerase sigma-70 factor (ECF subfamily)
MAFGSQDEEGMREAGPGFATTHWSNVFSAGQAGSPERDIALERLCRTYWYPLYSFVRRRGFNAHEAQDLTQGFFARFLEKNYVAEADAAKGRFRTFLLNCLQSYLANEWDRKNAQKRGGGAQIISIDAQSADERYQLEPVTELTPERIFEKQWLEALLESVLHRLREEFIAAERAGQFDLLKIYLVDERGAVPFSEMAAKLGVTESALKGVVRRMRQRYRDLFREEIAQTVLNPREVDAELQHLIGLIAA